MSVGFGQTIWERNLRQLMCHEQRQGRGQCRGQHLRDVAAPYAGVAEQGPVVAQTG